MSAPVNMPGFQQKAVHAGAQGGASLRGAGSTFCTFWVQRPYEAGKLAGGSCGEGCGSGFSSQNSQLSSLCRGGGGGAIGGGDA
jgi:hypothetical protein